MRKMRDLKKNIKTVWKSKKQILEGIRNKIFTNETVELISQERLEECVKCEYYDTEGSSCVVPGTAPCCNLCGCCLSIASRSLSYECKAGKWKIYISEDEAVDLQIVLQFSEKLDHLLEMKI